MGALSCEGLTGGWRIHCKMAHLHAGKLVLAIGRGSQFLSIQVPTQSFLCGVFMTC